jgi:hypothetical protein
MTKSPKGWWVGKVPKKAVTGKSVKYYFEGRNKDGKPVVRNGEQASPNFLLLMEEDAYNEMREKRSSGELGGEDTENPLEDQQGPQKRPILGKRNKDLEGLDVRFGKRKWWIGIGAGSGFGFAQGDGLEAVNGSSDPAFHGLKDSFQAGGAWAGLGHMAPEVGIQLTPNVALSLEGRFQYIPQQSKYARFAARGAISGLAKLMVYTKQSQIRFFGTALLGGGEGFRFVVKPASIVTDPNNRLYAVRDFQDTVKGGPVVGGAGMGMYFEATRRTSIVLEVHGLAGFPTFSFVVDANLALQFNFYSSEPVVTPGRYVPKEEDEEPK